MVVSIVIMLCLSHKWELGFSKQVLLLATKINVKCPLLLKFVLSLKLNGGGDGSHMRRPDDF